MKHLFAPSTCDWPHLANCEKPLEVEELLDNDETQDEDEVAGGGSGSALRASCPGAEEDTFLSWRLGGLPPPHPDFLPAASGGRIVRRPDAVWPGRGFLNLPGAVSVPASCQEFPIPSSLYWQA